MIKYHGPALNENGQLVDVMLYINWIGTLNTTGLETKFN